MAPELVILGNLLVDDVVLPDGTTRMAQPGGAALYAALASRLWDLTTGIVSWRGDDYPPAALERLLARGVDLDGVHELGRPGLRTWLLYEGRRRRVVHRLEGPTHSEVSPGPERIPPSWLSARAFHLAPMPLDTQAALVASLAACEGALVSLDPYDAIAPDGLDRWRDVLSGVDVLFASEDDLAHPDLDETRQVLASLCRGRLSRVVFKRGADGGLFYDAREERWTAWAPRAERVTDPTGCGDAFAAGVLAAALRGEPWERGLARGVVGASFALEEWGPDGLFAATPESARARMEQWAA